VAQQAEPIAFDEFARQLPRIFDALDRRNGSVVVERYGRLYRLEPEARPPVPRLAAPDDLWADYDPERVLAGLQASTGALAHVDRDQLRQDLRAQREQDSQGRHHEGR
jgi:hypothetical protein